MSLPELKKEAFKLSVSDSAALPPTADRLELLQALDGVLAVGIAYSLQNELISRPDRKGAAQRLRGLGKTDALPPTDAEVEAMLEESLVEKYLQ